MRRPKTLLFMGKRYQVKVWIAYGDGSVWFSACTKSGKSLVGWI